MTHGFELSDPAAEAALYDTPSMRRFVGIDLDREPSPDDTTVFKFRLLMEKNNLGDELFRIVNVYLSENGLKVRRDTIVDASIINAPTSTKNKDKQRDLDMHQPPKGNPWHFGVNGVDSQTKLIHSIAVTPANVDDLQVLGD